MYVALFALVGCSQPEAKPEPKPLTAWIQAWTTKDDGSLDEIRIVTSDGVQGKLIWMSVGKKAMLPEWFTHGNDAQKIRGGKALEQAWKDRVPGVYKMDYSDPVVRNTIFKDYEVDTK